MVELDEDHDPYVHRLLRGFVRVVADQEDHKNTALSALAKEFERASDASDTAALNELEKVLPHGQSVLDEAFGDVDQIVKLANYWGWHQWNRGRYQLARQSRAMALTTAE